MMLDCWFNAKVTGLKKGDIIKIAEHIIDDSDPFYSGHKIRIVRYENLSTGEILETRDSTTWMTTVRFSKKVLIGKIAHIKIHPHERTDIKLRPIKPKFHSLFEERLDTCVYISSSMHELKDEREITANVVSEINYIPVYFEEFHPQDTPAPKLMIDELEKCQFYICIIGTRYSEATIKEFKRAEELELVRIVFVKKVDELDSELEEFIEHLRSPEGITYKSFESLTELGHYVKQYITQIYDQFFED